MAKKNDNIDFDSILKGKDIPILVLDNKWHQLFGLLNNTPEIAVMELKIKELLKERAVLTSDTKKLIKGKKILMSDILILRDEIGESEDEEKISNMKKKVKLLEECKKKINDNKIELQKLPGEIDSINRKLMAETMNMCRSVTKKNLREVDDISQWVSYIRDELKEKLIRKKEDEFINNQMYVFLHNLLGKDIINVIDEEYFDEKQVVIKDSDD